MVVAKRRSVRVVLALLVLVLAGAFFLSAQPEPQSASPLESLLNGSSTDIHGALSSLDDADFPLALAVAESLKFKALHGDSNLSVQEIESFHQSLAKRIENGQTVSLAKTPGCPVAVPARKITLAGVELAVPAHFVAEIPFEILDFSPQGEAGSLLPDIRVEFRSGHPPVRAVLHVDGKPVPITQPNAGSVLFRPFPALGSVMAIGTHTASVVLTDAENTIIRKSWSFTIGLTAVPSPSIPPDAVLIGSFTVSLKSIFPDAQIDGTVLVQVFQTRDGRVVSEYSLFVGKAVFPSIRTTSLFLLRKAGKTRTRSLSIKPHTKYIFKGYEFPLKMVFTDPDATVNKVTWKISEGGAPYSFAEGASIIWPMKLFTSFYVTIDVTVQLPAGPVQAQYTSDEYAVRTIDPHIQVSYNRDFLLIDGATASMPIEGSRDLFNPSLAKSQELIEGRSFYWPGLTSMPGDNGLLTTVRSRWHLVGGSADPALPDPTATMTNLLFPGKGFVEVVHDVALSYDWEEEHYEMVFKPETSGLYGVFPYRASARFAKVPPGIILKTSRYVEFQDIDLSIDGNERKITAMGSNFCNVDPPIILGQSSLFPDEQPLKIDLLAPVFIRRLKTTYEQLPNVSNFRLPLKYDRPEQASGSEMLIRPYFISGSNYKTFSKRAADWETFFLYLKPLADWMPLSAWANPADLLQVVIDPQEPEVFEGQKLEFTGVIVPKTPALGSGEITEQGGSLNLLDGYLSQPGAKAEWTAILQPHQTLWKTGSDLRFVFEPKQGTGTYEIAASTSVPLKEEDTAALARATGISSTTALVVPGFKILTPIEKFAYPIGIPIKVTTNRDDDDALWKTIVWSVNGKTWKPDEQAPPAFFTPDKAGEYILAGTLKVKDANGIEVELHDQVKFPVHPVSIQLDPARKLVSPPGQKISLTLAVKLAGVEIKALDQVIDWASGTLKAKVEAITWKGFTSPTTEKPLTVNNPPLTAEADLDKEGPATILATVTVRIWSIDPEKPFDQKFSFSAARADLWAFRLPDWVSLDGKFPNRAIQGTKRLFEMEKGSFTFGGDSYSWSPKDGIEPALEKFPALPGASPIKGALSILWQEKNNPQSEEPTYSPKFSESNPPPQVQLFTGVNFSQDGQLAFPMRPTTVLVTLFKDAVEAKITAVPNSISINASSTVSFFFGEKDGLITQQTEFLLWKDEYKVTLTRVAWRLADSQNPQEGPALPQTDPTFGFSRSIPGTYRVAGKGFFFVEPKEGKTFGAEAALEPDLITIAVKAKVVSWSIVRGRTDHLERIAIPTGVDVPPYVVLYSKFGPWVWKSTPTGSATQPLAVGCDSTILLIPDFGTKVSLWPKVSYSWLSSTGSMVMSGDALYENGALIPTPPEIGIYRLILSVDGCDEQAWVDPVYVLYRITPRTFDKVFFTKAISDSTVALSGRRKDANEKDLVDQYYTNWWWAEKGDIAYYMPGKNDTVWVIHSKGGMCKGLGNLFFKSLECQGIEGLRRIGYRLIDSPSPENVRLSIPSRSAHPWTTEYWGAVVYACPALKREIPPFPNVIPYPNNAIDHAYWATQMKVYGGKALVPAVATLSPVINFPTDVTVLPPTEAYCFVPPDGHALVFFKDPQTSKAFLYDPSFGKGTLCGVTGGIEVPDLPLKDGDDEKIVVIKSLGEEPPEQPWGYLKESITYFRGNTFFSSSNLGTGIAIFDIPPALINFLKVRFVRYESREDSD